MEQYIDIIGVVAAILTTASFLPQAIKVIRTKDTHSLSLSMYIMFWLGVAAWLLYGVILHLWPIIIANIITLTLAGIILYYKINEK